MSQKTMLDLRYQNRGVWYQPSVLEGMKLETCRSGSPGVLTWEMYTNHVTDPGDIVELRDWNSWKLFRGRVFTTQHGKDGKIKVTAYDQLRFLKGKDTIIYENLRADQLIRQIAGTYHLICGELQNTGHTVKTYNGDNKTLFDIIGDALDAALLEKNELYILYDDFGAITLKNAYGMRIPILIDGSSAEDYDIQSSIDGESYNRVKLVHEDKEKNQRDVYIAEDSLSQNKWGGVLQFYDTIEDTTKAVDKVNKLLKLYDTVQRKVTIKGIKGRNDVRGGSSVYVRMSMGEVMQNGWMVVDKATHTWNGNSHLMDLSLEGGAFNAG